MSSAADPRWDRLTLSAKAAWRWAWATATVRSGTGEPSGVRVDSIDLLAGLTMAHLRDNPVRQLFEHFHIPLGAVLSHGGTRRYRPAALLATYRRIPDAELPDHLSEGAGRALEHAHTVLPPSSDGLITLAMLFGALLENTNGVSAPLRAELANRGLDVEPVLRSCREHLGTRESYAQYLRAHHPYRPPRLQLPSLVTDLPRTRRPPTRSDAEPPDLVGIRAEVNAFAYLIASRTLTPPLAIGLFGDWGSGKSYFLRSVQRRIDELVSAEVAAPPFYRAIAQVEFNAWQYVEGNLWASLLEHLFRNLRKAGEQDADDLLETRRGEYLKQITARTAEHRQAVRKRDELAERQRQADQLVQDKRNERDRKLADLESARRRNPFLGWKPSPKLRDTLAEVGNRTGLGELGTQAVELQQTLAGTGETLRRAGPVFGALRTGGWRYTVAVLALLGVIGLGPLSSAILSRLDVSVVSHVIGSVSTLLAGFTAYAVGGNKLLAGTLRKISQAQDELNAELDAHREGLNQEIRAAEIDLATTQQELASAVDTEHQLAASVAELEAQLARITPSSVLAEFLGDRSASDDYRRHLGVPALVRQDLERLSRLIQQRHEAGPADPAEPAGRIGDEHAIDRVVLYIDDLDRCPTHMVIKVLEAVHLLLSFPLFVVVVAVDARWLEASLREHYTQLNADQAVPSDPAAPSDPATPSDLAVPSDYLEKIFQVPFWVRPLGTDTRRQLVRGLLTPNLADPNPADPNLVNSDRSDPDLDAGVGAGSPTGSELSGVDRAEFIRLVESFTVTDQGEQPGLEAAKLTVTGAELGLIEEVSPLLAATPRAVKRFVNVYLLLKSVGRSRGWPWPEQGQVAVLLAIATGLPELADGVLPTLAAQSAAEPLTLGTALPDRTVLPDRAVGKAAVGKAAVGRDAVGRDAVGKAANGQLARLTTWLGEHPGRRDAALDGMGPWIELILRFRFDRVPGPG